MDPAPSNNLPPDPMECDSPADPWCGLAWSAWVPFNAPRDEFFIPKEPGVYRIRRAGSREVLFIGETGQSLHKKLAGQRQALRRADLMPWSDPHAEAPVLWAYWVDWAAAAARTGEPPVMLECSAAPLDASAPARKAMEAYLLSWYRQEQGVSPPGNFGRFHPRYRKSTTRKEGRRGARLEDGQKDNPAGWPGTEPLEPHGSAGDPDWMGLEWTTPRPLDPAAAGGIAPGAGLYLLLDCASNEVVLIGQAADLPARLVQHAGKPWDGRPLCFSYQIIGQFVLPHHLRELECDLLGDFFRQYRRAPAFQFRPAGQ